MSSSSPCRQFSLDEIKEATDNFDEKKVIGHGGEGKVYLAEISLGGENKKSRVAVKHLKENSDEFEKEIKTVTKIQHPHLVSLLGYCDESNQKVLIYEYMVKGSLSDFVKRNSVSICLSWKQRLKICLDAAHGLQHLHKETDEFPKGIIHRDVKPANILLGENWVAKVSDFGMFKLSIAGQTNSAMVTDLKGTCGYYAPEYFRSFRITRKIDVYAFGVVLFEVLCGKKPWERGDESYYVGENEDLGLWAQENVDTKIKTEISYDSLNAFTDILGRSLRPNPNKRPTMDDVILALKNVLIRQEREEEQIRNIRLKATRAPEIDKSELESLFSEATALDDTGKGGSQHDSTVNKPEKVQLGSGSHIGVEFGEYKSLHSSVDAKLKRQAIWQSLPEGKSIDGMKSTSSMSSKTVPEEEEVESYGDSGWSSPSLDQTFLESVKKESDLLLEESLKIESDKYWWEYFTSS